jgi:hypothetical protein
MAVPLARLSFLTVHVIMLTTPAVIVAYPSQFAHAADGAWALRVPNVCHPLCFSHFFLML